MAIQSIITFLATLFLMLSATTMTVKACSCTGIPTIESSFDNDYNTAIVRVVVQDEITTPEELANPFHTKRYAAYIHTPFKAEDCGSLREMRRRPIEIRTNSQGSMCGVHIDTDTAYAVAGHLQEGKGGQNPVLSLGLCQYYRKWDDLSHDEMASLHYQRFCRCTAGACGTKPTYLPTFTCPDATTTAGPSDTCRYNADKHQCTWLVECPTCQEDWDCQWGQFCNTEGKCEKET